MEQTKEVRDNLFDISGEFRPEKFVQYGTFNLFRQNAKFVSLQHRAMGLCRARRTHNFVPSKRALCEPSRKRNGENKKTS